MSYKVTVIIPTFNSEEFIHETIASIKNQTIGFENIELILIDDYSTDNTQTIINDYCSKYENIKTFESGKKTGTPSRARNIAIENASADYIMFIDHDDKYPKDSVESLYNAITKNSADIAIGKFQNFGENEMITEGWIKNDVILNSIDDNPNFFSINGIWRMIFPKEFLEKHKITFPEGVFAEDLTFMINSFLNAEKIVFIDKVVYRFRLRTGDGSSTSLSKGMHYLNGLADGYYYTAEVLNKKYYDRVFNQHLSCWLNDLILSESIEKEDKIKLLKKSIPLFEKMENIEPFPKNDAIKRIMLSLQSNNLDEALKKIEDYKIFTSKVNQLENELNQKKNQVAYLQTTKGWFNYKTNNIKERLKNKLAR